MSNLNWVYESDLQNLYQNLIQVDWGKYTEFRTPIILYVNINVFGKIYSHS